MGTKEAAKTGITFGGVRNTVVITIGQGFVIDHRTGGNQSFSQIGETDVAETHEEHA